jgi:mRNA interferase RelE/StbE
LANFAVKFLPSAIKELAALSRQDQEAIARVIDGLAENPFSPGAKKLQGKKNPSFWRVRVGDYRVIYQVRKQEIVVLVVKVAHRREVYRGRRHQP